MAQNEPAGEVKTTSIPEAGRALGISRGASYEAAKKGDIPTIKIGRLKRVPLAWLNRVLQGPAE